MAKEPCSAISTRAILDASYKSAKDSWPWFAVMPHKAEVDKLFKAAGDKATCLRLLTTESAYLLENYDAQKPNLPGDIKRWKVATAMRNYLKKLNEQSTFRLIAGVGEARGDADDPWQSTKSTDEQVKEILDTLERDYEDLLDIVPRKTLVAVPLAYCALFKPQLLQLSAFVEQSAIVTNFEEDDYFGVRMGTVKGYLEWLRSAWITLPDRKVGDALYQLIHDPKVEHLHEARTWHFDRFHGVSLSTQQLAIDTDIGENNSRQIRTQNPRWRSAREVADACTNGLTHGAELKKKWDSRRDFYPQKRGFIHKQGGKTWLYDAEELLARVVAWGDIRKNDVQRILSGLEIKPSAMRAKPLTIAK